MTCSYAQNNHKNYNRCYKNYRMKLGEWVLINAGWAAYAKHRHIFKSNLAICLKRQAYYSCVLPATTYGAGTWTLTKQVQNKLAAAQTKMERSMLNITYKDRKTDIWVRERTKVTDTITIVRKMKWSWAGHINRLKLDRWISRVTTWRLYDKKRRQGRPAKRWRDDLDKYWSDTIMADESTIQAKLETACWDLRPTTGHFGCPTMMMMMYCKRSCQFWLRVNVDFTIPCIARATHCDNQWRIVGSRGPGARNSVGPSAMVRPNVCQLGSWKPPGGVRGKAPEANAFWQQYIENWLKIRYLGRRLHQ